MSAEDLERDLLAWQEQSEPISEDGFDPDWFPTDDDGAERLLRRVRAAERDLSDRKAFVDAQIASLRAWADDRDTAPRNLIAGAERALEGYARAKHAASGGKTVTVNLPNGVLKLLAPQESLVVDDEAAAVTALFAADPASPLVESKYRVRAGELKKVTDRMPMSDAETEGTDPGRVYLRVVLDGEILPGCHVEMPSERPFRRVPAKTTETVTPPA